jgi:WD40 repeat protein
MAGPSSSAAKLKVFISYSRRDRAFAERLLAALEARGLDVLIDRRDLPIAVEFQQELLGFIRQADSVIFIVSRTSTASPWCAWELEQVERLGKRLAPVVIETVDDDKVPPGIRKINYVFFTDANVDGAGFEAQADAFSHALKADLPWIKEHTRLGEQARRGDERWRTAALLLRGSELEAAEAWSARQPLEAPPLTDLHRALIAASRRGATRRLRLFIGGSLAVALIAAGLAGIAFWQWGVAQQQKALAEQQRDIAERNEMRAEEERNGALVTQSRFLADLAAQRNAQGRTGEAMQLALEALPDEMEAKKRPLVREARQSLLKAFYQHAAELVVDRPGVTDGGGWGDDRVMFSADGAQLTATAADGSAMIVSLADGSPLRSWLGLGTNRYAIASGPYVFTSTETYEEVQAWDAATGRKRARITIGPGALHGIALRLNALGSVRGIDAKIGGDSWDLTKDASLRGLTTGAGNLSDLAISQDNKLVAVSSYDGFVQLRELASGALTRTLRVPRPAGGSAETMNSVGFNPAGTRLATTSSDKTVRIWDVAQGRLLRTLEGHRAATSKAIFSRDGRLLLSAAQDSESRLWNAETGDPLAELEVRGTSTAIAFSADGSKLAVTSEEGSVGVWRVAGPGAVDLLVRLAGHSDRVSAVAFSSDGSRLATVSNDGTVRVWTLSRYQEWKVMAGFQSAHAWADWHAPSQRLVVAGERNLIQLWDMAGRKKLAELDGHTGFVTTVALSPDGARLVSSSSDDGNVIGWDVAALRKLWTRKAPVGGPIPLTLPLTTQSFSPDGKLVLVPGENFTVLALATETGAPARTFSGHDRTVGSAQFSADGSLMIAAAENAIRIWNSENAQVVKIFPIESDDASFATLNPDGKTILAVISRAVQFLNADTGAVIQSFMGHEDRINTAALSADGRHVLTASGFIERRRRQGGKDNTVRLWDVETGALLTTLRDSIGKVARAGFDNEAGRIIAFSVDGSVRLYPYFQRLDDTLAAAKAAQRRCLTKDQRQAAFLEGNPPRWCITGAGREREPQAKWDGLWPYRDQAFKDWLALVDKARAAGHAAPALPAKQQ